MLSISREAYRRRSRTQDDSPGTTSECLPPGRWTSSPCAWATGWSATETMKRRSKSPSPVRAVRRPRKRSLRLPAPVSSVTLNDTRVQQWVTHRAHPGDRIAGEVERGVRAYFCISGGITIPSLLGSRSTYLLARFGGVEGRRLQAGDLLPVGPLRPEMDALVGRTIPSRFLPGLRREIDLRIIMGLCSYRLTYEDSVEDILEQRGRRPRLTGSAPAARAGVPI